MTWYGEKLLVTIITFLKNIAFYFPKLPDYPTYYYVIVGIIIIAILISIYSTINNNFIRKYGYPIVDRMIVVSISSLGIFVYAGAFWREYALKNRTDLLFPNIFLGFFLLLSILCWVSMTYQYYKQKRAAWWLNSLLALLGFIFLIIFTGVIVCICLFLIIGSAASSGSSGRKRKSYTDAYNEDLANRYIGENSAGINIRRSDDF